MGTVARLKQCSFPGCTNEFPEHYIAGVCGDDHTKQMHRNTMVSAVASAAHEDWREGWRAQNGDVPRMKTAKDAAWIEEHGTDQVDIAATAYVDLPDNWKAENRAGAEVAVDAVITGVQEGKALDDEFVETVSAFVHEKWLERNGSWASESVKVPYAQLDEMEKEKDRFFVRQAIGAL